MEKRTVAKPSPQTSRTATAPACNCNTGGMQPKPGRANIVKQAQGPAAPPMQPPSGQTQNRKTGSTNQQPTTQRPVTGGEAFRNSANRQPEAPPKTKYIFSATSPVDGGMDKSGKQQDGTAASKQGTCPVCGRSNNCNTVAGFAFDSAQVDITHKSQIGALARKIVDSGINSVTATGYTDASGPADYNLNLGYQRAQNVVSAVIRKMHKIKPYAAQNVFWKIKTKGTVQIASKDNPALDRKVKVCLQ